MRSTPSISVIIPAYNAEKYIARAIEGVMAQTLPATEIIVVNDGSKDGTLKQLAKFGDAIKVINVLNGGAAYARNTGIQQAKGELIAFLDADDFWYPEKLEKQLQVFSNHHSVGFSCCNFANISTKFGFIDNNFSRFESGVEVFTDRLLGSEEALHLLLRRNVIGTCSNVVIKREVLDKTGLFKTDLKQSEDFELWLRCALATDFFIDNEVLLEKIAHDGNLTNNNLETNIYHEQALIHFANNQLDPSIRHLQELCLAESCYKIGNLYYERNQIAKAVEYYLKGLRSSDVKANKIQFIKVISRKVIRTLSFGLIRNRS